MKLPPSLQKQASEQAPERMQRREAACHRYDPIVRRLLNEIGDRQWGRSWLGRKRYTVRRNAFWWYVMHSDLQGDQWYWVSFGDFDAEGNPLNFELEAAGLRIKTSDLSEASLNEALQLALEREPARWSPGDS